MIEASSTTTVLSSAIARRPRVSAAIVRNGYAGAPLPVVDWLACFRRFHIGSATSFAVNAPAETSRVSNASLVSVNVEGPRKRRATICHGGEQLSRTLFLQSQKALDNCEEKHG